MSYDAQVDGGLAVVHLHAREGRIGAAVVAAREEIARARGGGLSRGDIERARAQILSERVYGRENADGRAVALAFHRERFGDDNAWRAYDAAVLAVDASALTRVANMWLSGSRESMRVSRPIGMTAVPARTFATIFA